MKATVVVAIVISCLTSIGYAADENKPTKAQTALTNRTPAKDNPNKQSKPDLKNQPKPEGVQCWHPDENKWYNVGSEICYHKNAWRCGSSGKWYALGRTC